MPVARMARSEAIEKLRDHLRPGDTVYTVLRHTSASGMSRAIDAYTFSCEPDGSLAKSWLSYWTSAALRLPFHEKYEAVTVGGAGMDMGFHLIYSLSAALYPDGFDCAGERCPSNDHSNAPHPARVAGSMHHRSGGYALRQAWI